MNTATKPSEAIGRSGNEGRSSWPAQLDLRFSAKGNKTIVNRRHRGPLLIQRPFYPEADGTCHSYILHPPGGVAGGDSLEVNVAVGPEARCLLTAPGATKVYRTPGKGSQNKTTIHVSAGGVCEWMPLETILFNGAKTRLETEVHLQSDAIFFGWDLISFGRPAANERYLEGCFSQSTTITRDERPIWFERAKVEGGSSILDAAHGFGGFPIFGTALYAGSLPEGAVDSLRERVASVAVGHGSLTQTDDVLVLRYIGPKLSAGRAFFADAWKALRQMGQGKPASIPRIWAT